MQSPLSMQDSAQMRDASRAFAGAYDIEDAADDILGLCIGDPRRFYAGAGLDAFAAARAGIEHVADAFIQRFFKGEGWPSAFCVLPPVQAIWRSRCCDTEPSSQPVKA